jgi:M6 family metalloprotease-like protein
VTLLIAADSKQPAGPGPDLADYRTVETAITARISQASPGRAGQTGYLGVNVARDAAGKLVIAEVQPASPGDKAGLKSGDVVSQLDGQPVATTEGFRAGLQSKGVGETVTIGVVRDGKSLEVKATLTALSKPMRLGVERALFGARLGEAKENEGAPIESITPESPAASAGLKVGDHILKINGEALNRAAELSDAVAERKPGDVLTVTYRRDNKEAEVKVTLAADRGQGFGGRGFGGGFGGGGFGRGGEAPFNPTPWKKDVLRLAVVRFEFSDTKHNDKIAAGDWEQALFSRNTYANKENVTGQTVHGSLNDYFQEQSAGALRIEGKVFDWVELSKKRGDYSQGSGTSNRAAPLIEAVDKLLTRDGKEALKDFDALFFIYAGDMVRSNRGAVYYPHAGAFQSQGKRWNYLLAPEGGSRMTPLNGYVRECGLLLGLPSLAARTENVGSEGCGAWCLMSNPLTTGRPQHLCAWCKETLGWVKPVIIDPTVKQKLILAPIEDSAKECFKVLVKPDGSEYFLLENRKKKGFDADLPGEGLLIWRVVNGKPVLEESHGIEGAAGPRTLAEHIPYPSPANNAFTPLTTPSSVSPKGGGLPVHITEIRRLADGRITFQIGYEYR